VIGLLATNAMPFLNWYLIFGPFALGFVGLGLFCLVIARRARTDTRGGFRLFASGFGVFSLVVGSLGLVVLLAPSSSDAQWALPVVGYLLFAGWIASLIAGWIVKRRNSATTA